MKTGNRAKTQMRSNDFQMRLNAFEFFPIPPFHQEGHKLCSPGKIGKSRRPETPFPDISYGFIKASNWLNIPPWQKILNTTSVNRFKSCISLPLLLNFPNPAPQIKPTPCPVNLLGALAVACMCCCKSQQILKLRHSLTGILHLSGRPAQKSV